MLSSTSSSKQRLPHLAWPIVIGVALMALCAWVVAMETGLAHRGFKAGLLDSESLWMAKRARADGVGKDGLILVGDSRTQLDLDQDVLREKTGLEPVQLALNGTFFPPIFKGIAADPQVTGTVLVGFEPGALADAADFEAASGFERDVEHAEHALRLPDSTSVDRRLSDALHGHLRSYADGARPLSSLTQRLLNSAASPQYLTTLPDRSTLADYRLVPMPDFYYKRAFSDLGEPSGSVHSNDAIALEAEIKAKIAALRPRDNAYFRRHIADLAAMTAAITARGGRVIFVVFPESGYVRQIDDKLYPRAEFWDVFAAGVGAQVFNFADDPAMRDLVCPDGSHLDFRQRAAFTAELVDVLHLSKQRLPTHP